MVSRSVRLLCALGSVAAQDLFEKQGTFLAQNVAKPAWSNATLKSGDTWYKTITPAGATNLCIDVPGGTAWNGNPLWLWDCNGHDSQIWVFDNYQIRYGQDERYCIDAGSMGDGTQLTMWECNGLDQQTWGWDDATQKIYLSNTAVCLDWFDQDFDAGQPLHVWTCTEQGNQYWGLWDSGTPSACGLHFPCDPCRYDTGQWPSFQTKQDLENDQYWSGYFNKVYGYIPDGPYPICPGAFQFLWQQAALSTGIVQDVPIDCPGSQTGTGFEPTPGFYYIGQSFLEAKDVYGFIYNPGLLGVAAPANVWVEGTHTVFPGDVDAIWYYMSVGSGVWIWTGNTRIFWDHPNAMSDMLGQQCSDQSQDPGGADGPTECENNFPDLYKTASSQGVTTIQFTNHNDCTCGEKGSSSYIYFRHCPTEIIALDDPSGASLGCSSLLRGGWQAQADCACDENFKSTTKDPSCGSSTGGCSYANCGAY